VTIKLHPCPFCGAAQEPLMEGTDVTIHYVQCNNTSCGINCTSMTAEKWQQRPEPLEAPASEVGGDLEIEAMRRMATALQGLDGPARARALEWVSSRYVQPERV
jgi:hypothetical protein